MSALMARRWRPVPPYRPIELVGMVLGVCGVVALVAVLVTGRDGGSPAGWRARLAASAVSSSPADDDPGSPPWVEPAPTPGPICSKPAPTTVAGYRSLFASIDPRQWGAADVSISVPLPDGRVVWLYGDTFSAGRFVHSSAIVQDGGCLHVLNGGAQLLPNVDAHHIYWIRSASADEQGVVIVARAITLTGSGPWGFKDGGYDQLMTLQIDQYGNAANTPPANSYGWRLVSPLGPGDHTAAPDPGPMYSYGPHHFGYQRRAHPELRLADGCELVTTSQNWDDGKLHPLADYRPIFSEGGCP